MKGEKFFYRLYPAFHRKYVREFWWGTSKVVHCPMMKNMRALWYSPSGTFSAGWKMRISCHMCANQNYISIFSFFKAIKSCHTLTKVEVTRFKVVLNCSTFSFKFWEFQHSPIMLKFTCKIQNRQKNVMLCFYPYFDSGKNKLLENRFVSCQWWLPR